MHGIESTSDELYRLRWLRPDFLLAFGVPCLFSVLGRFGWAAIPFDMRHSVRRDSRGPEVEIFLDGARRGNDVDDEKGSGRTWKWG